MASFQPANLEIGVPRVSTQSVGAECVGISGPYWPHRPRMKDNSWRGRATDAGLALPALTLNPHPLDCRPIKGWGTLKTFWIAKVGHLPWFAFRHRSTIRQPTPIKGVIGN